MSVDPEFMRLLVWRQAIKLELKGMKRHGRPVTAIVRDYFKLPRTLRRIQVLEFLEEIITHGVAK